MEGQSSVVYNETSCPFCGGALGKSLYRNVKDRLAISKSYWTFLQCKKCGSAVLNPMPSQEELLGYYPPLYSVDQISYTHWLHSALCKLEKRLFFEPNYMHSVQQVTEVTGLRSGHLLDVGGGTGHRTFFFQKAGFEVTVLDSDERALKVAREKFGLKTICSLLEEAVLPDESFDIITFYSTVEHLPVPKRTLQQARRLLRPNGWVIALVPLQDSLSAQLFKDSWLAVTEAPRHVTLPSHKGMEHLFTASGLSPRISVSDSLLLNAASSALSLIPSSATPIACNTDSVTMRFVRRLIGALTLVGCLPLAWLENISSRPTTGIFFAQKA